MLLTKDDPRLRKVSKVSTPDLELGQKLVDIAREKNALGLSAIQIGERQRVFCAYSPEISDYIVFYNPEIDGVSVETTIFEEGCLSLPGEFVNVERPDAIHIVNRHHFGETSMRISGLVARIYQHEFDHLDGILMTDYPQDYNGVYVADGSRYLSS